MRPQKDFSNKNILFHALSPEYALIALEKNILEGRCTQRYWVDGLRRKDDNPLYESSYWMKGFSCTRDFDFAKNWNAVVFVFDKDKIKESKKIIPYAWNYGRSKCIPNHKKEREEFVLLKKLKSTLKNKENPEFAKELTEALNYSDSSEEYQDYLKDLQKRADYTDVNRAKLPEGSIQLEKIILGFYICNDRKKYFTQDTLDKLTKNKLFLGFID